MVKEKKKGTSGAATSFISRKQAMTRLQLSLKDFRRLCILKGIYPQEPKNLKKVNKGNSQPKTYYFLKDIQFLSHEPIIRKFREYKVFLRKLRSAQGQREKGHVRRLLSGHRPIFKLDHIVKERYPTFVDALRDVDDALSMCFLFATFPNAKVVFAPMVHLCRRLTVEFLHYVIESRSLRKVFISIKGYYFQAEIHDQKITWVVPHKFGFSNPDRVDFKIMSTYTHFYTTLLGFVNFKLFHSLNLKYPPVLSGFKPDPKSQFHGQYYETIASLSQGLKKLTPDNAEEEPKIDEFLLCDDADAIEELRKEQMKVTKQQKLFDGLRFFLNREVPHEPFTVAIRSVGGQVSWESGICPGSTYQETDETITHQIVDRPEVQGKKYINRYYVQPQWVFDCINERKLLPPADYFPGQILPPHLSPFVQEGEDDYIPPERRVADVDSDIEETFENEDVEDDEDKGDEEALDESDEEKEETKKTKAVKRKLDDDNEKNEEELGVVTPGKMEIIDADEMDRRQKAEEKRLAVMMIPKRKRQLYNKIMKIKKRKTREVENLKKKRLLHDKMQKQKKKNVSN